MKTSREGKTNDVLSHRGSSPVHQVAATNTNHIPGSITDMYPVTLDGGKTIIFISDKNKESETRQNYQLRREQKLAKLGKKFKESVVEP
jgi:hypothetical protein